MYAGPMKTFVSAAVESMSKWGTKHHVFYDKQHNERLINPIKVNIQHKSTNKKEYDEDAADILLQMLYVCTERG